MKPTKLEKEIKFKEGYAWCAEHQTFHKVKAFPKGGTKYGLSSYCKEAWIKINGEKNHKYNPINNKKLKDYPTEFNVGVYKIVDIRTDEIIYIGASKGISRRWYNHWNGSRASFLKRIMTEEEKQHFKLIPWIEIKDDAKRDAIEKELIKKYQPKHNVHNK